MTRAIRLLRIQKRVRAAVAETEAETPDDDAIVMAAYPDAADTPCPGRTSADVLNFFRISQ